MLLQFSKMHGLGKDFMVVDAVSQNVFLTKEQIKQLADRNFGIGFDQLLMVEPPYDPDLDFHYRIFNADGSEVEQCGNGARCFVRYVRDKQLTQRNPVRVKVKKGELSLNMNADGRVTVDMGPPVFVNPEVPFDANGLVAQSMGNFERWPVELPEVGEVLMSTLSMGNPHAVLLVGDVDTAPVLQWGPVIENHVRFPARVNVGFLQVVSRNEVRLRVFERGAGETLACGTGACAAVVAGVRLGLLDAQVDVHTHGGVLTIEWQDSPNHDEPVFLTGPATTVFEGEIEVPDLC